MRFHFFFCKISNEFFLVGSAGIEGPIHARFANFSKNWVTIATGSFSTNKKTGDCSPADKLLSAHKPDSVAAVGGAIIYLARSLLNGSGCLPSGIRRAVFKRRYTWHYSMQGLPASFITERRRGLLPHVFTFICQWQKVIFCGTICSRIAGPGA